MVDYEGFLEISADEECTRIVRKTEGLSLLLRAVDRLWMPLLALSFVCLSAGTVVPAVSPRVSTILGFVSEFFSPSEVRPETIEEQLVSDGGDVELTATEIERIGDTAIITFAARNKADAYREVQLSHVKVNDNNIEASADIVLPARCTAAMQLELSASELSLANIRKVAFLQFDVTVSSVLEDKSIGDVLWTGKGMELKTSAAENFFSTFNTTGERLFQGDLVELVSKGIQTGSEGAELVLLVNNCTGQSLEITIHQLEINGMPVEVKQSWEVDRFKTFAVPIKDADTGKYYNAKNIKIFSIEFSITKIATGQAVADHEDVSFFVDPAWNAMSEKVPTKTPQDEERQPRQS